MFSDDIICDGFVHEISVLSPSVRRAEPNARVEVFAPRSSPAQPYRDPALAGEEIIHGGTVIRRPGIGQVLGVR